MSEELRLFIENEKRKVELYKRNQEYFLIEIIEEWKKWWFKLNEIYIVRKYPFQATKNGSTTFCCCEDCKKEIKNKKLYDMYEVIHIDKSITNENTLKIGRDIFSIVGSLIPVKVCKILKKLEMNNGRNKY